MADANLLLEAMLDRAGISHAGLARHLNTSSSDLRLHYDHASVARWIRDGAIPRPPVPDLICQILGARLGQYVTLADIGMTRTGADPPATMSGTIDRATAVWRGDQHARPAGKLLVGTQAAAPVWEWANPPDDHDVARLGERRVDPADITVLRQARHHYQQMYRRVGGAPVRPRIVALLNRRAAPLLRAAYDDSLGRQLFRAVGGLAALAGVCAYDADEQPYAQAHLHTALRLAKASGDRQFGAYIVALLANQALYLDDRRLVVQYTDSALRTAGPGLRPALTLDLHALAGKAYARMGDASLSLPHLRTTESTAARLDRPHEHDEASYVLPGLAETQLAEALRRLGDLPAALTYAEESVHTANATHLRGQVHRFAGLALILAAKGDLDRSIHIGHGMLDRAEGMDSGRIHDRVTTVATQLRPHATDPTVAAFLERADLYLGMKGI
ncbi:hypothetical protein [Hamadaea tsunoensis]|uniref:hypothetical protein n=1 Tax=Hamadaea tsunoensis TaxID=53368 RepID=UPI00040BE0AD|nr:hypothetical protein [Hamadaea tsunoensis]